MAACLMHGSFIVLAIINAIALMYFLPERNFFTRFLQRDRFSPLTHIFLVFLFGAFAQKKILFLKIDIKIFLIKSPYHAFTLNPKTISP
jgi:hypothetical protein